MTKFTLPEELTGETHPNKIYVSTLLSISLVRLTHSEEERGKQLGSVTNCI
jgi:hypothetical protein